MGKVEGKGTNWHGHVTAITVGPEYRRLGLAQIMMHFLEEASDKTYSCYFVDLFVRPSNKVAVNMYKQLGYVVYRRILNYYWKSGLAPAEDGYDMRKALSKDVKKKSMIPLKHPVNAYDL